MVILVRNPCPPRPAPSQVARMHLNSEALNEQAGMMKTLTRVLVRTQSDKYLGF